MNHDNADFLAEPAIVEEVKSELIEIDSNSMQSKLVPGLFFAGEIINVDGVTGGFNFQNAWTTGWIAAQHVFAL